MSDGRSLKDGAEVVFVNELVAASRLERPRAGAKERALAAVVPSLGVVPLTGAKRGRGVTLLAAFAGCALVAAFVLGGLFVKHRSELAEVAAEAALHEQEAAQAAQRAKVDELMAELREQTEAIAKLQAAVANAKNDAERQAAEQALAEARAHAAGVRAATSSQGAGGAPAVRPPRPKVACNCTPGNPLCTCIP